MSVLAAAFLEQAFSRRASNNVLDMGHPAAAPSVVRVVPRREHCPAPAEVVASGKRRQVGVTGHTG